MCTVIIANDYFEDTALLIAGNRDERLDRPSAPPARVLDAINQIPLLAPLDLKAHGTWLGLNAFGLVSAVTNRFGQPPDPTRRSRGELVFRALSCHSAIEAFELLRKTNPDDYNRFNLIVADSTKAHIIWSDGTDLHLSELSPGIHVVTERSFTPTVSLREETLKPKLAQLPREKAPDERVWRELLSQHSENAFEGTCVHIPGLNYGTRSSTVLWVFADGTRRFLHAEGPTCRAPYQDYSSLAVFS